MPRLKLHNSIIVFLFFIVTNFAQSEKDVWISVDKNFDVRKVSLIYFGDANLWPYIFIYNKIDISSELNIGSKVAIPSSKVKTALQNLSKADEAIQKAISIGAKVLAEELLNTAISNYQTALAQKKGYEFDKVLKSSSAASEFAYKAYMQSKEIRERAFDAVISFKKGTVQKMFSSALKWQNAEVYENLKENDWARTLTLSLAKITFSDLNQIKLNENSQALIQRSRMDVLSNKASTKVRLEKGDAYAMLLNNPKKNFDLEIKGVKTKINSKYFWVEKDKGSTKIANYNGEIKIEAKDSAVIVQKNQGSVIPDGGLPSKPKNLLNAPELISPNDMAKIQSSSQIFSWFRVVNANSYWLEIAADADFKKMLMVQKNISQNEITINELGTGILYWRVCSVDSLGLPGPFTAARTLVIAKDLSKPFLQINLPANNISTRDKHIEVIGKISIGAGLSVNGNSVIPKDDGSFVSSVLLNEGKNVLQIVAKNEQGVTTTSRRTIYFEKDPFVRIAEDALGDLQNNIELTTNKNFHNFGFHTRPFACIKVTSTSGRISRTAYADSTGNAQLLLNDLPEKEELLLVVTTLAGYERKISLKISKDIQFPEITFSKLTETVVNQKKFLLIGSINEKVNLAVNGKAVNQKDDGSFEHSIILEEGLNKIEINAEDKAGNLSKILLQVTCDTSPPELISAEIKPSDVNQFLIIVKAKDETELKKTASAEVVVNKEITKYVLEYDQNEKNYKTQLKIDTKQIPLLSTITLSDYINNTKKYKVVN